MAQLIKANGLVYPVAPKQDGVFTLDELQTLVGSDRCGFIELVRHQDGEEKKILIVNEEGKIDNLPINRLATDLYPIQDDYYVGDVLVCELNEIN